MTIMCDIWFVFLHKELCRQLYIYDPDDLFCGLDPHELHVKNPHTLTGSDVKCPCMNIMGPGFFFFFFYGSSHVTDVMICNCSHNLIRDPGPQNQS